MRYVLENNEFCIKNDELICVCSKSSHTTNSSFEIQNSIILNAKSIDFNTKLIDFNTKFHHSQVQKSVFFNVEMSTSLQKNSPASRLQTYIFNAKFIIFKYINHQF